MQQTSIEVVKWTDDTVPDEPALREILSAEGLHPYRWSNSPGDVYGTHSHTFQKVIYVVRGSITFGLPDTGEQVELFPGDRLNLRW